MATVVLIHGALHGGWCWSRVVLLLQAAGHTVVAPDLPGHGAHPTPRAQVTLQAYVDRVCEVIGTQAEPIILVGHSMAGAVISQAAEQCPEQVKLLVYLAAALLPSGQSLVDGGATDTEAQATHYLRLNEAEGVMTIADEGIAPAFYHDCSHEDVAFARAHLVPQALAPFVTPLALTDARYGQVPRVYIETLQDRVVSLEHQRRMVAALPCRAVLTLDTSHSPFFAAPDVLAQQLASLA